MESWRSGKTNSIKYFDNSCEASYDWVIGTSNRYKTYSGLKGVTTFGIIYAHDLGSLTVHGSSGSASRVIPQLEDLKSVKPYQRIGKDGRINYDHNKTPHNTIFYKVNDTFILYKHPQFNVKLNIIDKSLPCRK